MFSPRVIKKGHSNVLAHLSATVVLNGSVILASQISDSLERVKRKKERRKKRQGLE